MAAGKLWLFLATTLAVWSVSQQTPLAGPGHIGARIKACRVYNRTVADCSSRGLRSVPDARELPGTIKTLYLLSNNFRALPHCAFCDFPLLEFVDLSFCNISDINRTAFAKLARLKTILLIGNNLTSLESGTFDEQHSITEVNLADNKLTEVPYGAFPFNNSLETLDLSGNNINIQEEDTDLDRFKSLQHFSFRLNNVSSSAGWIFSREDLNVSLQTLDLSYNRISQLDSTAFNGIRRLDRLVLSSNDILTVDSDSFSSLSQTGLETLVLFRNNLTKLTNNTFASVPLLKRLDLAYNNISSIEDNAFAGLRYLEVLTLYMNPLWTNVPMAALEKLSPSLLELDLRFCSILNIYPEQFRSFGNLRSLNISDNYIGALGSGHRLTGKEFDGLGNLRVLDIGGGPGYNRMKITNTSFSHLPKLQKVVMTGLLGFNERFDGSFRKNPDLRLINMDNMNIRFLGVDLFQGLTKLKELVLSNNNFYLMLNSDQGSANFARFFGDLTNLETLRLQGNRLESLQSDIFQNLTHLRYLNLGPGRYGDHNNQLSNLQPEHFQSLTRLETLRIDGNRLSSVEQSVFEPMFKSLKELFIYGNPFDCSCDNLRWFRDWVNNTRADVIGLGEGRLVCSTPRRYANESILSFRPEVDCQSQVVVIASLTVCSVLLAAALGTVVCRRFGLHKYVQYVWVLVTRCCEAEVKGRFWAPYYVTLDLRWIQRVLIPNLEEKSPQLKLCIPDRDTPPGEAIIDNVQDYIRRSRKTLCLITQRYLAQEASWLEMQVASYRLFDQEDRRDVVVMVFLEPIPKNKLTHFQNLRKLMRPGMFLHWPGEEDTAAQPLFWLLLRDALGTSNNPVPRSRPQVI
ncbi:toll-like receptor 3 [Branchiostoma lanceolatum]|uniref:toll-like receptor 3 n=1 Tax=Branchiostoma lanceolatum TaxID=7740 RepID=UPI0034548666